MNDLTLADLVSSVVSTLTGIVPSGTIALLIATGVVIGLVTAFARRVIRAGK